MSKIDKIIKGFTRTVEALRTESAKLQARSDAMYDDSEALMKRSRAAFAEAERANLIAAKIETLIADK